MAWELEPAFEALQRDAVLDRIEELLGAGAAPPAPAGRNWKLELLAERAILAATANRVERAHELVDTVLEEADPTHEIALARALLAKGHALAWTGTTAATREADRTFADAAERFAALGNSEWEGSALLRCGYMVWYQSAGNLPRAETLIRQALTTWKPDSIRRAAAIVGYADVLIDLGEFGAAEIVLDEAAALAELPGAQPHARAFVDWSRARVAAGRGDAFSTERLLRETERLATGKEWFDTHIGNSFLAEAAELSDRVGLSAEAHAYLERAVAGAGDGDEVVIGARAVLLGRSGDPHQALDALQEIVRGDWLEKRLVWRYLLLTAWATFRAGRDGAGPLTALALEQAIACGGARIAQAGEPELVAALAPLAERAGSAPARELLLDGRALIVRLFGTPTVTAEGGAVIELPAGKPGELVRMLALHPHGLPVEVVLETFFPEAPPDAARQRLRQVLTRLRATAGELVVRNGDHLHLAPAWVDAREFMAAAGRVRGTRGARSVQLAYAALALKGGPLLPTDPYAGWAEEIRREIEYRHLGLLDLVGAEAAARGSHHEALTALEAAAASDPGDARRDAKVTEQLAALGRHGSIEYRESRSELTAENDADRPEPR